MSELGKMNIAADLEALRRLGVRAPIAGGDPDEPEGAPAADMRYDDEDEVARVFVRVEWKGGKVREYEALEPQDFSMNDPETALTNASMRMAVQVPGSPMVPMFAAVPSLRLLFRANPRHNMQIRTERTASPRERPEAPPTPREHAATPPVLQGSLCHDPSEDPRPPTA